MGRMQAAGACFGVWSITCFLVTKEVRGQGAVEPLVRAAVQRAKAHGGNIVEAYLIDIQSPKPAKQRFGSYGGYMGVAPLFRALGFEKVGRASEAELIMRYNAKKQ